MHWLIWGRNVTNTTIHSTLEPWVADHVVTWDVGRGGFRRRSLARRALAAVGAAARRALALVSFGRL